MNHKRKRPRTKSDATRVFSGRSRTGEAPGHWNILFHSRPRRRRDKHRCLQILYGQNSDGMVWELGNRKPHVYYW